MTYAEKLKDPRWQKRRLEILQRDEWRCKQCFSSKKTLHIHHKDYLNGLEPWEYDDIYLVTLCEDCHEKIRDDMKRIESELLHSFRINIETTFEMSCLIDLLSKWADVSRLIYLLWEYSDKRNEIIDFLEGVHSQALKTQLGSELFEKIYGE